MMKRIAPMLLTALMLFSLAACSGKPLIDFSAEPGKESPAASGKVEEDNLIYPDEDDYAMGYLGDTLRTSFFDMTVNSAYTCYEFDGVTAKEGYKLLVAEITIYNYTGYTQPMFFTDFEIWWDVQEGEDEGDAWSYPLYKAVEQEDGSNEYYTVSDQQMPIEYDLLIRETREELLLYQVPEGSKTYDIAFVEYFEDGSNGALFDVRFSAPLAQ